MANVAVGVHVAQKTGQASSTGAVVAMGFLPMVVLSPIAGVLADRVDRRRYLAALNFGQCLVAATMASLGFAGLLTVTLLGSLAFASGCLSALANPAFTALVVELVPGDHLHSALSLNSAQFNVGRVIGPALAAVLFAAMGVPWVFALNAVSFAVIANVLRGLPRPRGAAANLASPGKRPPLSEGIREGLRAAAGDPGLRLVLAAVFAVGFFVAPFIGFIPVYALRELGGGAELASLLTSVQGLGAVGAVLLLGPLVKRFGVAKVTVGALVLTGPVAVAYWSSPGSAQAAPLIAVLGGGYLACLTGLNTLGQLQSPPKVHARISGLHASLLAAGYAAGLLGLGYLADRFGMREVLAGASFGFALLVGFGWWRFRPAWRSLRAGRVTTPPAEPAEPAV